MQTSNGLWSSRAATTDDLRRRMAAVHETFGEGIEVIDHGEYRAIRKPGGRKEKAGMVKKQKEKRTSTISAALAVLGAAGVDKSEIRKMLKEI